MRHSVYFIIVCSGSHFCLTRTGTSLNTNDAVSDETNRPGRMNSGLTKVSGTESLPSPFSPDRRSRNRFSASRQKGVKEKTSECEREHRLTATGRVACKHDSYVHSCKMHFKCIWVRTHCESERRARQDLGGQKRCFITSHKD